MVADPDALGGLPLSWPGAASCCISAVAYMISRSRRKTAQKLEEVHSVEGAEAIGRAFLLALPRPVAFRGRVGCNEPISSEDGVLGVILEDKTYRMAVKPDLNGDWHQSTKLINSTTNEAMSWFLDGDGGDRVYPIHGKRARGIPFTPVFDHSESMERNPFQHVVDHFKGVHHLGERRIQRMLLRGDVVTAVGELARGEGGRLEIRCPAKIPFFLTQKTLPELARSYQDGARVAGGVGLGAAVVGAALVLHKAWRRRRERAQRDKLRRACAEAREASRASRGAGLGGGEGAGGDAGEGEGGRGGAETDVCVICIEREYDAVFVGCGHLCVCTTCARRLRSCPICRKRSAILRVYKS